MAWSEVVKTKRESFESRPSKYLGEEISYLILGDAKDNVHIAGRYHASHKVILDGNMTNHPHSHWVGGDAKAGLRIGIEPIGLRAKKSKKGKHILDVLKESATYTGCNKFGGTGGVSDGSLFLRTPHNWSPIYKDDES